MHEILSRDISAIRYESNGSSSQALKSLLFCFKDSRTESVTIFGSAPSPVAGFEPVTDGPTTGLPFLAALVRVRGAKPTYIVFDGLFLDAERSERRREIDAMLDHVEGWGVARVALQRAPFTSSLSALDAAEILRSLQDGAVGLDKTSRAAFMRLL